MAKKRKLVVRKYDGDDRYSYAVFYADEIKHLPTVGPIMYWQAEPLASGLTRSSALHEKG